MLKNQKHIYSQILSAINSAENILLTCHEKPDGDSLGSMLSLYDFIKKQNKPVTMCTKDRQNKDLDFLPWLNLIHLAESKTAFKDFDLIIYLDCGCYTLSGVEIKSSAKIINIDHHATNKNFGNINLVDATASATCEIIFDFLKYNKTKINSKIATLLLTGIILDTDNFVNPNTTSQTLNIASKLVAKGGNLNLILNKIYKNKSIKSLKIWGELLSRLKIDKQTGLAVTAITQNDLEKFNTTDDELIGISNFLNKLDEKGSMFLRESEEGVIKGSLRTNKADVDVSKIASTYSGGGHVKAAGFKIKGKIIKTKKGVWKVISEK